MLIWFIFAVLTAAVMVGLLAPFRRRHSNSQTRNAFDREVYRDQLTEVDADVARGVLGSQEAEAARIEISRRLIASEDPSDVSESDDLNHQRGTQFRNLAFWSSSILIPVVAIGAYLVFGHADMPGQPHAARFEKPLESQKIVVLIARVEERLRQRPDDGRGWEVIAPVYMRQGRHEDAADAYQRALKLLGENAALLTGYAEALISLNQGIISDEARQAYEKVLAKNDGDLRARFRLALAQEQDGKIEAAADQYRELMLLGDPDSPWRKVVSERLAYVNEQMMAARRGAGSQTAEAGSGSPGPTREDIRDAQSMSSQDRTQMINSMVKRLATRLKDDGNDIDGWLRLMNAYAVLGKRGEAKSAFDDARRQFTDDKRSLSKLDQLARKLGLQT